MPCLCVQPSADEKKVSFWAFYLVCYNYRRDIRQKLGPASVLAIMPGTYADEGKDGIANSLNPNHVLAILVEALLDGYENGVDVVDGSACTCNLGQACTCDLPTFKCRLKLLAFVADYRGLTKFLEVKGSPTFWACFFCWIQGAKLGGQGKTVWAGAGLHSCLPITDQVRVFLANTAHPSTIRLPAAQRKRWFSDTDMERPAKRTREQLQALLCEPPAVGSEAPPPAPSFRDVVRGPTVGTAAAGPAAQQLGAVAAQAGVERAPQQPAVPAVAQTGALAAAANAPPQGMPPPQQPPPGRYPQRQRQPTVQPGPTVTGGTAAGSTAAGSTAAGSVAATPSVAAVAAAQAAPRVRKKKEQWPKRYCPLFDLPWWTERNMPYDTMHFLSGVVKGTCVKGPQGLRIAEQVLAQEYDALMGKQQRDYCADAAGVARMQRMLHHIASKLPTTLAGQRLRRLMTASKVPKAHTFLLFAGPIGARVLAESGIPPKALEAYIRVIQACSDLWNKRPSK